MFSSAAASARRSRGLSRRWLVLALAYVSCLAVVLTLLAVRWIPRWRTTGVERWPRVARIDVELDLSRPPELAARGRYVFDDVRARELSFLLNRGLEVESVCDSAGRRLTFEHRRRLRSDYHSEGRVVSIDLGREPTAEGERVELELSWRGRGDDGTSGRDWRGILLLADDEVRASEQTIALPLVPVDAASPAHEPTPGRVQVLLPDDFEAYVPGTPREPTLAAPAGARALSFELPGGAQFGIVAGRYVRGEIEQDGLRVVSMMKAEHAALGPELLAEAARASAFFGQRFGRVAGESLGVCEIATRGPSYNWAGYGLVTFESGALGGGVPRAKVGHEVAHLWFGQAVRARGPGERFLTEGLAEYASWRWLEECEGTAASRAAAQEARQSWLDAVHERGADPALAKVGFGTPDYQKLAYSKGALVVRAAEHVLGREVFDARLTLYVREHAERAATLEDFAAALAGPEGRPEELLPWLTQEGHAHLALADIAWDSSTRRLTGRLAHDACPEGIPSFGAGPVTLRATGRTGSSDIRAVPSADGRFSLELEAEPDALFVDPEVARPIAGGEPFVLHPTALVRSSPRDGEREVDFVLEAIELEFDRPLAPLGARDARQVARASREAAKTADLEAPWIGAASLSADRRTLTLALKSPMRPGAEHLLALGNVLRDEYGVPVGATLRFETRASDDHESPRVVACEPENGAADVDAAITEVRITFSEPMSPGRGYSNGDVRSLERRGAKFPLGTKSDSEWTADRRTLVYALGAQLTAGTKYVLPLRSAFRDTSGNALTDFDYEFETR